MDNKQAQADLILKLYDLRREAVMRKARAWFAAEFHPASTGDVMAALQGENGAYLRMIMGYWEMASALVLHGAIDTAMFHDANGEHLFVYTKIEPFVAELRQKQGPNVAANLEKLIKTMPDAEKRVQAMRERQAAMRPRPAGAGR